VCWPAAVATGSASRALPMTVSAANVTIRTTHGDRGRRTGRWGRIV
jgi:hypothetical protein